MWVVILAADASVVNGNKLSDGRYDLQIIKRVNYTMLMTHGLIL